MGLRSHQIKDMYSHAHTHTHARAHTHAHTYIHIYIVSTTKTTALKNKNSYYKRHGQNSIVCEEGGGGNGL